MNRRLDVLLGFLPIIIIIGVWIFLMRRMSGSGGGAGGQIFNIGKSKAKLFDQNTEVKVTFKDVAGAEEAKEELEEIKEFLDAVSLSERSVQEQAQAEAQQQVLNKAPLKIYLG